MHAIAFTYTLLNLLDATVLWGRVPRSRKAHSIEVEVVHDFVTASGPTYEITHNAQQYKCSVQS